MPQASNIMYRDSETKVTACAFRNPQQCPLSKIKKVARSRKRPCSPNISVRVENKRSMKPNLMVCP